LIKRFFIISILLTLFVAGVGCRTNRGGAEIGTAIDSGIGSEASWRPTGNTSVHGGVLGTGGGSEGSIGAGTGAPTLTPR
jgi:hypothetical protein